MKFPIKAWLAWLPKREPLPPLPMKVKEYVHRVWTVQTMMCPRKPEWELNKMRYPWECLSAEQVGKAVVMEFECPAGQSALDLEKQVDALAAHVGCPVRVINELGKAIVEAYPYPLPETISLMETEQEPGVLEYLDKDKGFFMGINEKHEPVYHNFYQPHMIICGETGFGKSSWLMLFLYQLITFYTSEQVQVQIVDLKGTDFLFLEGVPHVLPIVDTIGGACEALKGAYQEMNKRKKGVKTAKRSRGEAPPYPKLFLIVDEAVSISPAKQANDDMKDLAKKCDYYLSELAQMGRSLGIHILYCTQYPLAEYVHSSLRANCGNRMVFRLDTPVKSEVGLGESGAEELTLKGRGIYKTSAGKQVIQVPFAPEPWYWDQFDQYRDLSKIPFIDEEEDENETGDSGSHSEDFTNHAFCLNGTNIPLLSGQQTPGEKGK